MVLRTARQEGRRASTPVMNSPAPARDYSLGYWNFVGGAIVIMFILYAANKGSIGNYVQLLFYTPPATGTGASGAAPSSTGSPSVGTVLQGMGQGATAGGNPFSPSQGLGNLAHQYLPWMGF